MVAAVPADVESVYGIAGVLGGWTNGLGNAANALPNGAGTLRLRKKSGAIVLEVQYTDQPPWPEAADGQNGWTIGAGQVYADAELQNQADATALYRLLEDEIVPLFFARGRLDMPEGWLEMMVHCLQTIPPVFNTDRMVQQYCRQAYEPLARNYFAQQA